MESLKEYDVLSTETSHGKLEKVGLVHLKKKKRLSLKLRTEVRIPLLRSPLPGSVAVDSCF